MKPTRFILRAAGNDWVCEARNGPFFSIGEIGESRQFAISTAEAKFATEHNYPEPRKSVALLDLDNTPRKSKSDLGSLLI